MRISEALPAREDWHLSPASLMQEKLVKPNSEKRNVKKVSCVCASEGGGGGGLVQRWAVKLSE